MQLEQVRSPPACQLLSLSLSLHTEAVNDVIQNSKTLKNQQTFHCFLHDNEKVTQLIVTVENRSIFNALVNLLSPLMMLQTRT